MVASMRLAAISLPVLALLSSAVLLSTVVGCTKTRVTAGPDGILRLDCARGMKDCVSQAEKYCNVQKKDGGYVIMSGASRKILMGSENSQYRTAAEVAQLEVKCGTESLPIAAASEGHDYPLSYKLPPRTDADLTPAEAALAVPAAAPATASSACTKGSTQACVGPGACQGGQVCLADGSGYGPCDCGSQKAASPAPAPSPPGIGPVAPPPAQPPPTPGAEPLKKP